MKFILERTSRYGERPHKMAKEERRIKVDVRNTDDPKKIPAYKGRSDNWWYDTGTNHRVHNGYIMRDIGHETIYTIEINSLEELLEFSKECGTDLVIGIADYRDKGARPRIEIYDHYRE